MIRTEYLGNGGVEKNNTGKLILASIRKAKQAQKKAEASVPKGFFQRMWECCFGRKTPEQMRQQKVRELRFPERMRGLRHRPTFQQMINTINISSNFFTKTHKKYIDQLERFHFPQMAKTKISYELIEHFSNGLGLSSNKRVEVQIDGKNYRFLDGTTLNHPIFVHATKMTSAPLILQNQPKFFNDNPKFSISLFENGRTFFHSNDPKQPHPGVLDDEHLENQDFYVALGLTVDPRTFYRNYPQDVGSPCFNHDPNIQRHGHQTLPHVESHIKMNRLLGLIGAYIQDLHQRVYIDLEHPRAVSPERDEARFLSPYSDTHRIFRLESVLRDYFVEPTRERFPNPVEFRERMRLFNARTAIHEQRMNAMQMLWDRTGHRRIRADLGGYGYSGTIIHNFKDEMKELKHRSGQIQDRRLREEVEQAWNDFSRFDEFHTSNYERIAESNYRGHGLAINDIGTVFKEVFWTDSNKYTSLVKVKIAGSLIKEKISGACELIFTKIFGKDKYLRYFFSYHEINYRTIRLVRLLGPTETLDQTQSYNEFEALSHQWGSEYQARLMAIKFLVMSRIALMQMQNIGNKAVKTEKEIEQINQFKTFAEAAKANHLPILIVDTDPLGC